MELDAVIRAMESNEGITKSAAAQTTPSVEQTNLNAALEKAAGVPPAPTADLDAVDVLMKTANELAGTEKEAEIAHAAICGQAFADGAIAKFAAYDTQVQKAELADPAFHKKANQGGQVTEEMIKAAAEQGYEEAREKLAADYQSGHDAALQQVHDAAAVEFIKGASEVEIMVQLINQAAQ